MRVLQDIRPTAEQLVILRDAATGFRLIRGAAGSGKTTAALMRLRQLCAARAERRRRLGLPDPVRVLVLTFNRTLRGYVEHLAAEQVEASEDIDLTVETVSHWALGLCEGQRKIVDQQQLIRQHLVTAGFTAELEYFVGEVEYVLGRFQPVARDEYLHAERSGRGRVPAVPRQRREKLLADVIAPYEEEKARTGRSTGTTSRSKPPPRPARDTTWSSWTKLRICPQTRFEPSWRI